MSLPPGGVPDLSDDCWRLAKAERAAVLVDGEAYFAALRAAMLKAEHCIHIVGWDLDRRMLLPGCAADVARLAELDIGAAGNAAQLLAADGYPLELGSFLAALVERKPKLWVRLLLWDFSLFFVTDRELLPAMTVALRWKTPRRLDLCLDDAIPIGSAHHQKLVTIDDTLAFCGGMDLTLGRWDDCAHAPGDARRRMLDRKLYPPVHDVQMMVDGAAAKAIAEHVRSRWARAAYETLAPVGETAQPTWPERVPADFSEVRIALARTEPAFGKARSITEVERLYARMIAEAERVIYIENQYLTSEVIAASLSEALQARPGLEVVIVSNHTYVGWLEGATMIAGRRRFMQRQQENGVADRVRLFYPRNDPADPAAEIKVHSKLMIVDDRYLRVGSANLCARSMGCDTEFDLVILGDSDERRRQIAAIRNRLVAEHCGAEPRAVAAAIAETGSLRGAIDRLNGTGAHRLEPVPEAEDDADPKSGTIPETLVALGDPEKPIDPTLSLTGLSALTQQSGQRRKWPMIAIVVGALLIAGLAAAWTLTPLRAVADPHHWQGWMAGIRGPWEGLAVVAAFVIGGFVAFPLMVLIAGTTAMFGVWPGAAYAAIGAMASALATYGAGRSLGQRRLRRYFGPSVNRIKRSLDQRGIITMTTVRLIPAAPYTLVNLAAGALHVPAVDYTIGTALGLAPGIVVMSLLGSTIVGIFSHPTFGGIALIVGLLVGTIVLSIGLQMLVRRVQRMLG